MTNGPEGKDKSRECEHELAICRQRIEELNAELDSLSYSISHDLRAPLRAIHGFSKALAEDYEQTLDDDGKRYLGIILSGATQMSQMIEALLSLSRLGRQRVDLLEVDMEQLVRSLVSELTAQEKRKMPFQIHPLPRAEADLKLIRQAWFHLLSNALKFTAQNPKPAIEIGSESKEDQTVYFIRDNGVGFDTNYATKLFGLFQRFHSDKEFPGVGAGLAIVQRIVRRHGGNVWADAKVNEGAVFYFSLPKKRETQM